jgi:hypothetical protein
MAKKPMTMRPRRLSNPAHSKTDTSGMTGWPIALLLALAR